MRHFYSYIFEKTKTVWSIRYRTKIIWAFVFQSIIQLISILIPDFANFISYFSRSNELQEAYGGGVRGLALSSGTGWSLGLAYGLVYIIFAKRYLLHETNVLNIMKGILLLIGTFFAGRTGFIGAALGIIFFFISNQQNFHKKIILIFKTLITICLSCIIFYITFPILSDHLVNNVFPFTFEPFYKLYFNDEFSTDSTNTLLEMWTVSISPKEILLGCGSFTDPTSGLYYKHVDVGILRNLFYWGIIGYSLIIIYQLIQINTIQYSKRLDVSHFNMKIYKSLIFIYLSILEFKAMTLGFNKMIFSIIFLIAYFYFQESYSKDIYIKSNYQ